MAGNCLTCRYWLRSSKFLEIGFCQRLDEHPVKRLRFQHEVCEGYKGESPRKPYRGTCREQYKTVEWSNLKEYQKELAQTERN